jgi:phosphoribosyl-AMP cyclohydrolase
MEILEKIKFDANGLVPAIAQDAETGDVLMMAYMNRESLERTIKEKRACYWSRSRKKFWVKGETSGHIQEVKEINIDCDGDTVLLKVIQHGPGACHMGYRSCFFRKISDSGTLEICLTKVFDEEKVYKTN